MCDISNQVIFPKPELFFFFTCASFFVCLMPCKSIVDEIWNSVVLELVNAETYIQIV